jgi:uncharacterized protein (TIGR02246 family)
MRIGRLALLALSGSLMAAPAGHARAQDPLYTATRQQLDVVKVILAQQDAWNHGDLDAYLATYKDAKDTQALLATLVRGLDNIRAAYRLNFPNKESMGSLEDSDVQVRALGDDYALATGRYHLMRSKKAGGPSEGTFTEVFEKTAAGWRVVFSEST